MEQWTESWNYGDMKDCSSAHSGPCSKEQNQTKRIATNVVGETNILVRNAEAHMSDERLHSVFPRVVMTWMQDTVLNSSENNLV